MKWKENETQVFNFVLRSLATMFIQPPLINSLISLPAYAHNIGQKASSDSLYILKPTFFPFFFANCKYL